MYRLIRRVSALLIALAIVVLIVYDATNGRGFSRWWAEHAITTSLVSDLLIVGATALTFNEVQAYRQRKERSLSVAAQGLIVYGQAREAYQAVVASISDPSSGGGIPGELRDLASNLLMASLFAAANGQSSRPGGLGQTGHLTDQMNAVQSSFQPLVARFPDGYQARVRDADRDIDTDSVTGADDTDGSNGASAPAADPGPGR